MIASAKAALDVASTRDEEAKAWVPVPAADDVCSAAARGAPACGKRKRADELAAASGCCSVASRASLESCSDDDVSDDDATSSGCSSLDCVADKVVVLRRYCIIYTEDVPESYFTSGAAELDIEAVVQDAVAEYKAAGLSLVEHAYAQGVKAYNAKGEDGEMWCNIPEQAVDAVIDALGDKLEDIFEECGFLD